MFHRFVVLTLMQLSEKGVTKRSSTAMKRLGTVGKTLFAMGVSFGLFTAFFYILFNVVFLTASTALFIFLVFLLQLLSILTSTVSLSHDLYTSRDNMLLMTYPVKHIAVFISKLVVQYILELRRSLMLTLPLFFAYGISAQGSLSAHFVLGAFAYAVLLPLLPVLIGSLLSIPFVYLSKVFKRADVVKGVFTLLLFAGLITILAFLVNWLNEIGEIRLVAIWNRFQREFNGFLESANRFSLYVNFVGHSMLDKEPLSVFLNWLYMFATIVGLTGLVLLAALPTFYRLASSATENASNRPHKGKNKTHKSTFFTFVRKETTLALRNLANFASDYVFLFAMPFILILMMTIFTHINRNSLGFSLTYGILALVTMVLLSVSNTASATAISSEGNEFVLLKTAPGDTKNIIWSKLLLNFVIAFVSTLISYILLTVFLSVDAANGRINIGIVWVIFGLSVLLEVGQLLGAIQYDILNPRLREFANSQNKNEIKSSSRSILSGLVTAFMGTILIFASVLVLIPSMIPSLGEGGAIALVGGIVLFIGALYAGIKFFFLIQYRDAYFEEIQL